MSQDQILVVDDQAEMRLAMSAVLKRANYSFELSNNANDALKKFKAGNYSLVITDLMMPKRSGIELLKDIKAISPDVPVIVITAYGKPHTLTEAIQEGAFDYIQKNPVDYNKIIFLIERALAQSKKNQTAIEENQTDLTSLSRPIITQDPATLECLRVAAKIAKSRASVLIQSESGTGKELLARYIHQNSGRTDGPLVAINCAALPESLLESELFGHKKGAFTGAIRDHRGKFEQAQGGTILLDEISEMALNLQAKLLRVLQEYTVTRIGDDHPIAVDVRLISTTNREMHQHIEQKAFREDLYYRLNVVPLHLPPLRERKHDIPLLADFFVDKYAKLNQIKKPNISPAMLDILLQYHWRGNIRELENVIERAVLLSTDGTLLPEHLLLSQNSNSLKINKPKPTTKKT